MNGAEKAEESFDYDIVINLSRKIELIGTNFLEKI